MLFTFLTANGQDGNLSSILHLDFDALNQNSDLAKSPLDLYYQNLGDILQVILQESDDRLEELSKNKEIRLDALEVFADTDDPWYGFVKSEIKLQWAFVNFKFGNDWNAFWGLRSAFSGISKNVQDYPAFSPNNRTLGLLHVIFGNVPPKNQWLMNLFGLRGDVFEGLTMLNSIDKKYPAIALEADLMLSMIQAFLLEDYSKAIAKAPNRDETKDTPLVRYINALVQLKAHNALQARVLLETSTRKFPFHEYLTAETYFQSQDYPKAISLYQIFLNDFEGSSYIKDAYLKIALSYLFLDDQKRHKQFLKLAIENGTEQSEIDKNAAKIIKDLPNQKPMTLKIRFAIDGGFYDLANEMIADLELQITSPRDKLELVYRKARIQHLSENSDKALNYYQQVIDNVHLISETYYGPNSFLQAGYLLRESGNETGALKYFERVLKLKGHPYKTSLDAKAKIAIKRLSSKGD